MTYTYQTKGTCSSQIQFDLDDSRIHNVKFTGGCNGNLKAIAALIEGMDSNEVIERVKGIRCGFKNTSCADQLALAIQDAVKQQ